MCVVLPEGWRDGKSRILKVKSQLIERCAARITENVFNYLTLQAATHFIVKSKISCWRAAYNFVECCYSLAHFILENGISSILKRHAIKNAFSYSGCMFSTRN